jgi:hypothetical protein
MPNITSTIIVPQNATLLSLTVIAVAARRDRIRESENGTVLSSIILARRRTKTTNIVTCRRLDVRSGEGALTPLEDSAQYAIYGRQNKGVAHCIGGD